MISSAASSYDPLILALAPPTTTVSALFLIAKLSSRKKQKSKTSTRLSYHSNVCWIDFDDDDIFVCWAIVLKKELVGWHHELITERMAKL